MLATRLHGRGFQADSLEFNIGVPCLPSSRRRWLNLLSVLVMHPFSVYVLISKFCASDSGCTLVLALPSSAAECDEFSGQSEDTKAKMKRLTLSPVLPRHDKGNLQLPLKSIMQKNNL